MGILCFSMAAAYLPVLVIAARKFALLYTLGSIFFISSFSLLYGPKKHFKECQKHTFKIWLQKSNFCLYLSKFSTKKCILTKKKHLISAERLPFTSSYICSMLFTLYAALGIKSYLLTIVAAGVQCVALTYFTLSYIPGGQTAIKFMAKMFYAIFSRCFKSITNV